MKKAIIVAVLVLVLGGGLIAALQLAPKDSSSSTSELKAVEMPTESSATPEATLQPGRYESYDGQQASQSGYTKTVLFFYAPWCPECRAFDQAITQGTIPDGVQILKVDYDSSSELKQRYGVTLQSTFVRVDTSGAEQATWVGYGKDKSINAILGNL